MLVEVTKTTQTREKIDVELPYFYKHDLMQDHCNSVIYGKIDDREHHSIQLTYRGNYTSVEVEQEPTDWWQCSCYLKDEYKSNADEYAEAKAAAMALIQSA